VAGVCLTLLGGFQARAASGEPLPLPTKKAQALLAYLALRPGQAHPRDKLATLLWGDTAEARARDSLRHALAALRKTLPAPARLVLDGPTVALDPAAVKVDVAAFEQRVAEGSPAALKEAAALYQGDLLEGLSVSEPPFEEWLLAERERLRELAIEALAKLLAHQTEAESSERAIQTAVKLLALDPLQEAVHRALMRLYVRQGRRAAALRQYQVCVGILQRELGAEPEAETRRLYHEIVRQRRAEPSALEAPREPSVRPTRPAEVQSRPEIATHETRLIGRDTELARLVDFLDEMRQGRGRVVAILGEAGIGKTRLIEELASRALQQGSRVLIGRCYESEQVIPFAPWVDALRSSQVPADGDLMAGLDPLWRAELARLLPELGSEREERDGEPNALERRGRLFEAVARLVERLAAAQPLALVLEDLHWADEMSLRLLASMARRLQALPVLVVVTAREEEVAGAPYLRRALEELDQGGRLYRLAPQPLSRSHTALLVRALARAGAGEEMIERLAERIWQTSEGNPFVVVEAMRAVGEDAALRPDAALAVPERVRHLITGHLDRLSPGARELVAVAAVVGREFDFVLLQRAAGQGEQEAAEGVEELVRRRILRGIGEQFDFTHDRIRQVVNDGLLSPTRRALHFVIAEALEDLYAGDLERVYDRLAYHYARTDQSDKAVTYLTLFAERSAHGGAHEEAIAALDQALGHVARLPQEVREERRLDLVLRKARSLFFLGRFEKVLDLLLPEEPQVEAAGNPRMAAAYYFRLGSTFTYMGDRARATESAERALSEASRCGDVATMGKAHFLLALESFWARPVAGVEHGREAVALLERTDERWWLGQACWILGLNLSYCGRFEEGLGMEERARALGESTGDRRLQSYAAWTTGFIRTLAGDWETAVLACRRSVELSLDPLNRMTALGMLALAHVERSEPDEAIPLLEQAIPQARRFRIPRLEGLFLTFRGEAALQKGDPATALDLARQGVEITRSAGYVYGLGWSERVLARIALASGDLAGARAKLEEAIATFASMGAPFEAARTRLELAALLRDAGDAAAARPHAEAALEALGDLGLERFVDRARALLVSQP
jgi:DNA-binding SARP family transcriptional activator